MKRKIVRYINIAKRLYVKELADKNELTVSNLIGRLGYENHIPCCSMSPEDNRQLAEGLQKVVDEYEREQRLI